MHLGQEKAFGTTAHLFLFGALRRIGSPQPVVALLGILYCDNVAIVRLVRRDVGRFRIIRGLRQGRFASGRLWATALEGDVRAMGDVFRWQDFVLAASADGDGCVLGALRPQLPTLRRFLWSCEPAT